MAEQTTTGQRGQSGKSNGKWQNQQRGSQASSSEGQSGTQEQILDTAKQAFDTVSGKASEYVDQASEYMRGFDANPNRFIREYPVQAAIGGVVIGFLLGAAVCRRSTY